MSLAARIAIGPSRTLARAEAAMTVGGLVMVAWTVALHLLAGHPYAIAVVVGSIAVASSAFARRSFVERMARPVRWVATSDREEVDLWADDGEPASPCRLHDSTVSWPAFAMVCVRPIEGAAGHTVHLPAFDAELGEHDAWALRRFLRRFGS